MFLRWWNCRFGIGCRTSHELAIVYRWSDGVGGGCVGGYADHVEDGRIYLGFVTMLR
jgi:hypothetical protein